MQEAPAAAGQVVGTAAGAGLACKVVHFFLRCISALRGPPPGARGRWPGRGPASTQKARPRLAGAGLPITYCAAPGSHPAGYPPPGAPVPRQMYPAAQ
jgi:hypothetical protein